MQAAGPRPIIAGERPQEASLGLAAPGIEHGEPRLVAEQLRRYLELSQQMIVQRLQLGGRCPDPSCWKHAPSTTPTCDRFKRWIQNTRLNGTNQDV
jgi:hypothetical protein